MQKPNSPLGCLEDFMEEYQMNTNDPQEEPTLSQLLRPLGEKKVQLIRNVVKLSFGVIIFIVVIILLFFIIAGHLY